MGIVAAVVAAITSVVLGCLVLFVGLLATSAGEPCEGVACVTAPTTLVLTVGIALVAAPLVVGAWRWRHRAAWPAAGLVVAGLVALVAASQGSTLEASARGTGGRAVVVDPASGRVGPARLGGSLTPFDRTFGTGGAAGPAGNDDAWLRLGVPGTYRYPRACASRGPDRTVVTEYLGAQVTTCVGRAFLIVVTSRGSRTTAGAAIGEDLDAAARRHPGLRCHTSTGSTTDPPVPVYRYCTGRVGAHRYLWLGQDPVSSIALSTVPLA